MNLTTEQIQAAEKGPITLEAEGKEFILVSKDLYEQSKRVRYDDSPLTSQEEEIAFLEAGKLAGWDDPEMDIYNDLDPRKS